MGTKRNEGRPFSVHRPERDIVTFTSLQNEVLLCSHMVRLPSVSTSGSPAPYRKAVNYHFIYI